MGVKDIKEDYSQSLHEHHENMPGIKKKLNIITVILVLSSINCSGQLALRVTGYIIIPLWIITRRSPNIMELKTHCNFIWTLSLFYFQLSDIRTSWRSIKVSLFYIYSKGRSFFQKRLTCEEQHSHFSARGILGRRRQVLSLFSKTKCNRGMGQGMSSLSVV